MPHAALTIDLDDITAGTLRSLSERWGVPPQEAVKRAVRNAAETVTAAPANEALDVFRQLQRAVGLTKEGASAWKQAVTEGRR